MTKKSLHSILVKTQAEVSNYFKLCCYGHNYMRSSTPVHQVEIVDQTIDQLYNLLSTTACATTQAEENELLRSATQAVQNQVIKNFPGWTDTSEPDEVQPQVIIFRTNFFCWSIPKFSFKSGQ